MRGATRPRRRGREALEISIHAPHARSDKAVMNQRLDFLISIHAPHARSDLRKRLRGISIVEFQSTLLMRGATSAPQV